MSTCITGKHGVVQVNDGKSIVFIEGDLEIAPGGRILLSGSVVVVDGGGGLTSVNLNGLGSKTLSATECSRKVIEFASGSSNIPVRFIAPADNDATYLRTVRNLGSSSISLTIGTGTTSSLLAGTTKSIFIKPAGIFDQTTTVIDYSSQSRWYIDAVNGNDSNSGSSAIAALKTHGELARRWGKGGRIYPPYVPEKFCRPIYVHILSDLPSSDVVNVDIVLGPDVSLFYIGGVAEVLGTGTFTSITTENRATNQAFQLRDSSVAAGFWSTVIGHRVRVTTGARQNSICWVAKDLGSSTCRTSLPGIPSGNIFTDENPFLLCGGQVDAIIPQVGDSYAVERLRNFNLGYVNIQTEGHTEDQGLLLANACFCELEMTNAYFNPEALRGGVFNCTYEIVSSRLALSQVDGATCGYYTNSLLYGDNHSLATQARINYGLFLGPFTNRTFFFGCHDVTENWTITGHIISNALFQNCRPTGFFTINSAGIFDCVDSSTHSPGGHALVISHNTKMVDAAPLSVGPFGLWGSGNAGAGVYVEAGSTFAFPTGSLMSITGSGGAYQLAGATTSRAWDEANGVYTAVRSNTWSNLTSSIGSGGFSNNAHNLSKNAHIVVG